MKLESLVIADQHAAVNTFSGLVHTARHTMRAGNARSRWPNRKEGAVEGRVSDWGQVVTRYPYENVGMDHLLSKEKDVRRKAEGAKRSAQGTTFSRNVSYSCSVLRDLRMSQNEFGSLRESTRRVFFEN